MPSRSPVRRAFDAVRERPRVALATGATAVAAILVGGGLALALGGPRGTAVSPTPDATLAAATATASPSPTPSIVPTPTPTVSPSPSPSPSEQASPTATPLPTPAPTRAPTPTPTVDRLWTALPAMPDAEDYHLRDAIALEDGRVVAFRHPNERGLLSVVAIEPGDAAWTEISLDVDLDDSVIYQWAQATDGRIYSHGWVIDPSGERWDVEPFEARIDEDPVGPVAATADGHLYLAGDAFSYLAIFDVETGERRDSSPNDVIPYAERLMAAEDVLYLIEVEAYGSYDPATDTWTELSRHPYVHAARAGLGPDGRIYVLDSGDFGPRKINAIDPETDTWSEIPRPIDAPEPWTEWNPIFLTGPDGRLWAVDALRSYRYIGD